LLKVEFHAHTIYSKDSLTSLESLLNACRRKGIDRIVITDHNTIDGALDAHKMDAERVIVGEEIMTSAGELLAVFVHEEIPRGLSPLEAIARLRDQGAFISVSHPFDVLRKGGWELPDLLQIAPLVDAIETFNSRCVSPGFNRKAQAFARQHNLPGTVGSDAHTTFEVGNATLLLPEFHDTHSLQAVIRQGQPQVRLAGIWVHFASTFAKWYKKLLAV
jgi:predicted metal-dependent phosphoesterase TrpH